MWIKKDLERLLIFIHSQLHFLLIILFTLILFIQFKEKLPNYLSFINQYLGFLSAILALTTSASVIYKNKMEKDREQRIKEKFKGKVKGYLNEWVNILSEFYEFYQLDEEIINKISETVSNRFFKRYKLTEQINEQFEDEINDKILGEFNNDFQFTKSFMVFFKYKFHEFYQPEKINTFLNSINKNNLEDENSKESEFFKMLYLSKEYKVNNLQELEQKSKTIKIEDIESFINSYIYRPKIIEQLRKDSNNREKYEMLKKLVDRCILKGYVSSEGLISLLSIESDILCIFVFEGGLKNIEYKGKQIFPGSKQTPFREILNEYGFIKPSPYSKFAFMFPIKNLPKKYHSNIELFIEKEILSRVNKKWNNLKRKYDLKKIREGPLYKYIAFTISKDEICWKTVNQRFFRDFEENILGEMGKEKNIQLLTSQIHNIPGILKKMEIDSLIDSGTDTIKKALRYKQKDVNKKLTDQGYEIKNVTDYRKLYSGKEHFAKILKENGNEFLDKGHPRAKRIDEGLSFQIADEIINRSNELNNLISHLGIKV